MEEIDQDLTIMKFIVEVIHFLSKPAVSHKLGNFHESLGISAKISVNLSYSARSRNIFRDLAESERFPEI
jgi:predicted unusual protein kinase regulating ubiquinone biosynthesis (AarF/ABC1/UbiB family)